MKRMKKVIAIMLAICMCMSALPVEMAKAEETSEYAVLDGYIGGKGFDKEIAPEEAFLDVPITVIAACKDTKKMYVTKANKILQDGRLYYSLKMESGHIYHISFGSGSIEVDLPSDRRLNILTRTKIVPGWHFGDYESAYELLYPDAVELGLSLWSRGVSERIENTSLTVYEGGQTALSVYAEYDGDKYSVIDDDIQYKSANESIATVDNSGNVKGIAVGSTTVTVKIDGKTTTCDVVVKKGSNKKGFDYRKDGFCFPNASSSFFYGKKADGTYGYDKYIIQKERFDDLYGYCPDAAYEDLMKDYTFVFNENDSDQGSSWGGYCFGMVAVAARLYNGTLDINNYNTKCRCYEQGDTVNEGLYDGVIVENGENAAGLNMRTWGNELGEEIEKYWLWQSQTNSVGAWRESNKIQPAELISNWKNSCYMIDFFWEEGKEIVGHTVLANTASDVPTYETDEDGRGYYNIPIYDPNAPAFTDKNHELYETVVANKEFYPGKLQYIKVYADGSGYYINETEKGSDVYILDINSLPKDINGSCTFENPIYQIEADFKTRVKILKKNAKETLGIIDIYDSEMVKVYDPELHVERFQATFGNGNNRNRFDITYDGDITDLEFEVEGGCHCRAIYYGNIQSVNLNGNGSFSFSEESVEVNAADTAKASIMMSSVKNNIVDDGSTAEVKLDSGESAKLTLNDQKKYQVVSDDKIESTIKVYDDSYKSTTSVSATKKQKISTAKYKKTYSAKKLKSKKVTFQLKAKSSGKGKISYKVTKGKSKYITVSKTGKVTLKKGCKKGTYKILITANKKGKYKKTTKTITIKVK